MVLGFLFVLPCFIIVEGIYLLRHPRTFSGLAVCVWAVISGIGFFLGLKDESLAEWAIGQVVALIVYYMIKLHR